MSRLHLSHSGSAPHRPHFNTSQWISFYDLEEIIFKESQLKNPSMNFYKRIEGPLLDCKEKIDALQDLHSQIETALNISSMSKAVFYQRLKKYLEDIKEWSKIVYQTQQAAQAVMGDFADYAMEQKTVLLKEFEKLEENTEIKKSLAAMMKLISRIEIYEVVAAFFWDNKLKQLKIHDGDKAAKFIQIVDSQWDLLMDVIMELSSTPWFIKVYKARVECRANIYKSAGAENFSKEIKEDLDFSRSESEYLQYYMELEEQKQTQYTRQSQIAYKLTGLARRVRRAVQKIGMASDQVHALEQYFAAKLLFLNNELLWVAEKSDEYAKKLSSINENKERHHNDGSASEASIFEAKIKNLAIQSEEVMRHKNNALKDLLLLESVQTRIKFLAESDLEIKCSLTEFLTQLIEPVYIEESIRQIFLDKEKFINAKFKEWSVNFGIAETKHNEILENNWAIIRKQLAEWDEEYQNLTALMIEKPEKYIYAIEGEEIAKKPCAERRLIALQKSLDTLLKETGQKEQAVRQLCKRIKESILKLTAHLVLQIIQRQVDAVFKCPADLNGYLSYWLQLATVIPDFNLRLKKIIQYFKSHLLLNFESDDGSAVLKTQNFLLKSSLEFKRPVQMSALYLRKNLEDFKKELATETALLNEKLLLLADLDRRQRLQDIDQCETKFVPMQTHLERLEEKFAEAVADFDRQTDFLFKKSNKNDAEPLLRDMRNSDEENATFNFLLDNGVLALSMPNEEIKQLTDEKLRETVSAIRMDSQESQILLTPWIRNISCYAGRFKEDVTASTPQTIAADQKSPSSRTGEIGIFVVADIKQFEFEKYKPCYVFVKQSQTVDLYYIKPNGIKCLLKLKPITVKKDFWEKLPLNRVTDVRYQSKLRKMIKGNPGHPKNFPLITEAKAAKIDFDEVNPLKNFLENFDAIQKKTKKRVNFIDEKFIDKDKLDKSGDYLLNLIARLESQAYILHLEKNFPNHLENFHLKIKARISNALAVETKNHCFNLIKSHTNLLALIFELNRENKINTPLGKRLFSDRVGENFKIQTLSSSKTVSRLVQKYTQSILLKFIIGEIPKPDLNKEIGLFLQSSVLKDEKEINEPEFLNFLESYKKILISSYIEITLSEFILFFGEEYSKTEFIEKFLANIDNERFPLYRWIKAMRAQISAETGLLWQVSDLEKLKLAFPEPGYAFLDSQRAFNYSVIHSGVKEIVTSVHKKSPQMVWQNYQSAMACLALAKKIVRYIKQQPPGEQIIFYMDMVAEIGASRIIKNGKNGRASQNQHFNSQQAKIQQYLLQTKYAADLNKLNFQFLAIPGRQELTRCAEDSKQRQSFADYYRDADLCLTTKMLLNLVKKWDQSQLFESILLIKLKTMSVELILSQPEIVQEKIIYLFKRKYLAEGHLQKEVWCIQYRMKWEQSTLDPESACLEIVANISEIPSRDQIVPFIKCHELAKTRFINFHLENVDQYLSDKEKFHFWVMVLSQTQKDMRQQLPELKLSLSQATDITAFSSDIYTSHLNFDFVSTQDLQRSFMDAKEIFVKTFKGIFCFSEIAHKYMQKYRELCANLELLMELKKKNGQNLSDFFGLEFISDLKKPLDDVIHSIDKDLNHAELSQYLIILREGIANGTAPALYAQDGPVKNKVEEYKYQPVIKKVMNLLKKGGEFKGFKSLKKKLENSQWVKRLTAIERLHEILKDYSTQPEMGEILHELKKLHGLLINGEWRRSIVALPGQTQNTVIYALNIILGDSGLARIHFLHNVNLYHKISPSLYVLWCWQFENKYRQTSHSLLEEAKNFKHNQDVVELINLTHVNGLTDIDLQELAEGNNTRCAIRVKDSWGLKIKLPEFEKLKNNPELFNQKLIEMVLAIFPKHSKTSLIKLLREHYDNCRLMMIAGKLRSFLNHEVIKHDKLKNSEFQIMSFFKTSIKEVKLSNEMPINTIDDAIERLTEVLHRKTTSAFVNKMLSNVATLIQYLRAIKSFVDSARINDAVAEITRQREHYVSHLLTIRQELEESGEKKPQSDVYLNFQTIVNWLQEQQDQINQHILNIVPPCVDLVLENTVPAPESKVQEHEVKSIAKLGEIKVPFGNFRKQALNLTSLQCTFITTHNTAKLLAAWESKIKKRDALLVQIRELELSQSRLEPIELYNARRQIAIADFGRSKSLLEEKNSHYAKLKEDLQTMQPRGDRVATDEKQTKLDQQLQQKIAEKALFEQQMRTMTKPSDSMRIKIYEQKQAQFSARIQTCEQEITRLKVAIESETLGLKKASPSEDKNEINKKSKNLRFLLEEIKDLYQHCANILDLITGLAVKENQDSELTLNDIELPQECRQFLNEKFFIDYKKQVLKDEEEKLARLRDEYYELNDHVLQESHGEVVFELIRQCQKMKLSHDNSALNVTILKWLAWLTCTKSDANECRQFIEVLAIKKQAVKEEIKYQPDYANKYANFNHEYNIIKAKLEKLIDFIDKDPRARREHKDSSENLLTIQFQWMQFSHNYHSTLQVSNRLLI